MTDEKYVFVSEVRDKKRTATGAFHKRTHAGKGGAVKFPSDFMTQKERNAMNGEVTTYRMNDPMTWAEFRKLPDDIKIMYIKSIREKFGVSDCQIFKMMGISQPQGQRKLQALGLGRGRGQWPKEFDAEAWERWLNGVPAKETDVQMEATVESVSIPEAADPVEEVTPVPYSGMLQYEDSAMNALAAVGCILGDARVRITVRWECVEDDDGRCCQSVEQEG